MRSHVDFLKLLLMQLVIENMKQNKLKKFCEGEICIASLTPDYVHTNDGKRVFINEDLKRNYVVNKNSKYQHTVQQQHIHHQYNLSPEMQQTHNQEQHRQQQHGQQQHGQQQQRPTSSSTQSTNAYRSGVIDPMGLFRNPSVAANAPGFLTFIPSNMDVANPSGHVNIGNNYPRFSGTSYDNVKSGQTNFEADNNMAGTDIGSNNLDSCLDAFTRAPFLLEEHSVPSFSGNLVGRLCTSNWQSCRQQCVKTDPNSGCPICTCESQTIEYNTQSSTADDPAYRRPVNELFNNPSGVENYRTEQISDSPDHPKEDDKVNRTCPDYLHDCLPDCINFDSRGCLVCRCDFVTCRPFSRDCPREFSTIDHSGCPFCLIH